MIWMLGLDPGLANAGVVVVQLDVANPSLSILHHTGVFHTESDQGSARMTSSEVSLLRAQLCYDYLQGVVQKYPKIAAICVEAMSYPPSASSAAKMAIVWGVIASISRRYRVPVLQLSPQQIKMKIGNRKDLSKKEVEAKMREVFHLHDFSSLKLQKDRYEHLFDALGAVYGCRDHEYVLLLERQHAQ